MKSPDLLAWKENRCTGCGELLIQEITKKGWIIYCPNKCKPEDEKIS